MTGDDAIEVAVELLGQSDAAYRVKSEFETAWVPKSLSSLDLKPGGSSGTITLPQWLAEKKGLV